jgi:hypothetical protein
MRLINSNYAVHERLGTNFSVCMIAANTSIIFG